MTLIEQVRGILYSTSQLNRTASQAELASKFGATMSQITTTSLELIVNYQAPASGIIGQLAAFGTTFVAFRSAEASHLLMKKERGLFDSRREKEREFYDSREKGAPFVLQTIVLWLQFFNFTSCMHPALSTAEQLCLLLRHSSGLCWPHEEVRRYGVNN